MPTVLEAVALAVHLKDVNAVSEAVQQGAGEPLRAEDLGPLVESRLVVTRMDPLSQRWPKASRRSSAPVLESGTL